MIGAALGARSAPGGDYCFAQGASQESASTCARFWRTGGSGPPLGRILPGASEGLRSRHGSALSEAWKWPRRGSPLSTAQAVVGSARSVIDALVDFSRSVARKGPRSVVRSIAQAPVPKNDDGDCRRAHPKRTPSSARIAQIMSQPLCREMSQTQHSQASSRRHPYETPTRLRKPRSSFGFAAARLCGQPLRDVRWASRAPAPSADRRSPRGSTRGWAPLPRLTGALVLAAPKCRRRAKGASLTPAQDPRRLSDAVRSGPLRSPA